jgi:hypothetical protein
LNAWDQLPVRMAVHFDANWQANGWTTREGALQLGLSIMAFLLVLLTIAAYAICLIGKPASTIWIVLATFYFSMGLLCYVNHGIVEYNLHSPPQRSTVRSREILFGLNFGSVVFEFWWSRLLCSRLDSSRRRLCSKCRG